jgi:hypothetical protein
MGFGSRNRAMAHGSNSQNCHSLCLAGFTTLRFVLELFIVEEQLLPGREDKIRATIDALQHLVPEFH